MLKVSINNLKDIFMAVKLLFLNYRNTANYNKLNLILTMCL